VTSEKNLMQTTVLATPLLYFRYITLWNEVVVWPLTTTNSYWIVHALVEKWSMKKQQTWFATIVFSKSHTCKITSSLLQHVLKMSYSSANASSKCWHHSQTAGSTTCISQGSVATVLKWDGQMYSHLRRSFFLMLHAKHH